MHFTFEQYAWGTLIAVACFAVLYAGAIWDKRHIFTDAVPADGPGSGAGSHRPVSVRDRVELRVKKVIADQLGVDMSALEPNAHIINDLGADSLDHIELCMAIEEEFGLELDDEDFDLLFAVMSELARPAAVRRASKS